MEQEEHAGPDDRGAEHLAVMLEEPTGLKDVTAAVGIEQRDGVFVVSLPAGDIFGDQPGLKTLRFYVGTRRRIEFRTT